MEDKELIDYYEDLFGQLQEIEAKLPGLREEVDGIHKVLGVIQETKVSFEKEVQEKQLEFEKTAKSHRDNISKLTSSNLKKITDHAQAKIADAEQANTALQGTIEKASEIEKKLEITNSAVLKINAGLQSLAERIRQLEKKLAENDQEIVPDYAEVTTALELYKKYFGKTKYPLVIERVGWTKDYCFRVTGIKDDETALIGRYYQMGKLYGNATELPTNYQNCRLYNGPTLEALIASAEQ